ncbi:16S rRNA (adenine(1518)-N(6)/adenine(1519)-N(6))-dimethyltransferase RsmA [Sandaracinobacter sp. RS1-74]|uniref:16S rRNA (adenine(1518)-N(6)/adenine(1519)-N(6))- dimethyltransferase RsmA n=1 Tax=Sandaracinobacteroides sayramensis TaxID=2913411 RepID=UPI001EDA7506|nr:16S rRNA (adenine(1518)-N(6)/adenine(1519)-N(6))-dimethyltransferase RsmA [Sandaracinobacteroides sayramensis]
MASDAILALPPLRDEIAAAGLRASKALGQNFLLDPNLLDRIVRSIGLAPGDRVYEVGPGPGGLTRALLKTGAEVVAIERDSRAIPILQRLAAASGGRLRVLEGDALKADPRALVGEGAHIAANLPYNIGTLLLTGWLTQAQWRPWWRSATLMFQKEVADRLVARPGTPAYGRLSVLAQLRADVRIETLLPARAFTPPPKVDSAVVRLVPKAPLEPFSLPLLERLTAAGFGQRRKMLRQSLKGVEGALAAMERLGLDPTLRAEALSISDFAALSTALDADLAYS